MAYRFNLSSATGRLSIKLLPYRWAASSDILLGGWGPTSSASSVSAASPKFFNQALYRANSTETSPGSVGLSQIRLINVQISAFTSETSDEEVGGL